MMFEILSIATLVCCGIFFTIKIILFFRPRNKLGIDGSLIWTDTGKTTEPFFNHNFKVFGKPDLMYKIRSGVLAVEYKSRKGRIYTSDIVQAKSAALAARGSGYHVTKILVRTKTKENYFDLPRNDLALYKEIEVSANHAREAKTGKSMNASPSHFKCRACAYRMKCQFA